MSENNKNLLNGVPGVNENQLENVTGGANNWWESLGVTPKYSIGQRVRCSCTAYGHVEDYDFDAVGTIRSIDYLYKVNETFVYEIVVDDINSSKQSRHMVMENKIYGLA